MELRHDVRSFEMRLEGVGVLYCYVCEREKKLSEHRERPRHLQLVHLHGARRMGFPAPKWDGR